jgi:hypothetical protein
MKPAVPPFLEKRKTGEEERRTEDTKRQKRSIGRCGTPFSTGKAPGRMKVT